MPPAGKGKRAIASHDELRTSYVLPTIKALDGSTIALRNSILTGDLVRVAMDNIYG